MYPSYFRFDSLCRRSGPFLNDGYPEDWVKTLDALERQGRDGLQEGAAKT